MIDKVDDVTHSSKATRSAGLLLSALVVCAALTLRAGTLSATDDAVTAFLAAKTTQEAAARADAVVRAGMGFDDVHARLKQGREYSPEVPRGVVRLRHRIAAGEFEYSVEVPRSYDPARAYPVRVQLHGGVMGRQNGSIRGSGSIGALAGAEQIYVMPASWRDAPWWSDAQLQNVRVILDTLKRTYNVDENRIALAGVSDGATAAYYFAMRDATPFSSFLALNGHPLVLTNPSIVRNANLFPQNLLNKPLFIINGALDLLYPTEVVEPFINRMRRAGVEIVYRPQPEGEHNTSWWPDEKDAFEAFVSAHPREPYPDRLTWETDGAEGAGRAHWLVIDRLAGGDEGRAPLPDLNQFARFPRRGRSGRVDLERDGNTVRLTTRGVSSITLLISPDAFDLSQPVTVVADGRTVFQERVEKDLGTLMKWAARDNDRTMLFGAEVRVTLPR
jgi:predicted esterase